MQVDQLKAFLDKHAHASQMAAEVEVRWVWRLGSRGAQAKPLLGTLSLIAAMER